MGVFAVDLENFGVPDGGAVTGRPAEPPKSAFDEGQPSMRGERADNGGTVLTRTRTRPFFRHIFLNDCC